MVGVGTDGRGGEAPLQVHSIPDAGGSFQPLAPVRTCHRLHDRHLACRPVGPPCDGPPCDGPVVLVVSEDLELGRQVHLTEVDPVGHGHHGRGEVQDRADP